MSEEKSAGASYLAALKQVGNAAGAAPARAPDVPASSYPGEKRRSPRYRCQGSARLREMKSGVSTWATFTDISLHGCYVEAMSAFTKGTELAMTIEVNGYRVECLASVQIIYPGLGMGVAFTTMTQQNRERLRELLHSLSEPSVILGARAGLDRGAFAAPGASLPVTNPAAALRAIMHFFEDRQMLDRAEFFRLVQNSQQ